METVLAFFIAGFFTGIGWWSAEKVTNKIDTHYEQKNEQKDEQNEN